MTKRRLVRRLKRLEEGHFGDVKCLDGNIYKLREHFGAGYRMYYIQRHSVLIVMLAGGDKSTQSRDIAKAKRIARDLQEV